MATAVARLRPEARLPTPWRRRAYLAMVALLPLHTVFLSAWVSWKPFLVLLIVLVAWDARDGWRQQRWPWHRSASVGLTLLLAAVLVSWPGPDHAARFAALFLALGVGGAVMLVTERSLRVPAMMPATLKTVFWSGAALAASAVVVSLAIVGAFGADGVQFFDDLPGVARVGKPTYLDQGFVALTNWHQDPGYAAAWSNLWAALALVAIGRGLGTGVRLVDAAVLGGLGYATLMTFSRTGWVAFALAMAVSAWLVTREGRSWRWILVLGVQAAAVTAVLLAVTWALDDPGTGGDLDEQFAFRLEQGASLGLVEPTGDAVTGTVGAGEPDYRSDVWPEYVDLFQANPARGAGLGTGWATPGLQEPHNLVLQLLGETGLIGLAGFVALLGIVLYAGWGVPGLAGLTAAFASAFTQTVLFEPTWWFAAGLLLGGGAARARPGRRRS